MTGDAKTSSGDGSNLYRVLVDRFERLESSHAKLREELELLTEEKRKKEMELGCLPGCYYEDSPYRKVLDSMGHAVYVCSTSSGEIIYWNHFAENLYGWKVHEAVGQRPADILIAEEHHSAMIKIMEQVSFGQLWSGQFPHKNRSGQVFMAMVTKSPFYLDDELAGVVIVSSDAAMINTTDSVDLKTNQDGSKIHGVNLKRIQWHPPRPQLGPVPQLSSSVSNLVSKLLPRKQADDNHYTEEEVNSNSNNEKNIAGKRSFWKDESVREFAQPSKLAAKVLAKLNITDPRNSGGEGGGSVKRNYDRDKLVTNGATYELNPPTDSTSYKSGSCEDAERRQINKVSNCACSNMYEYEHRIPDPSEECNLQFSRVCNNCCTSTRQGESRQTLSYQGVKENDPDLDGKQSFSSGESIDSHGSPPIKGATDLNMVDCEICWEDLQLRDEIGQGSFAVVYHGIWNGSDVAVKVYFGNEYNEGTLDSYRKEIDIMKKLRHPNVLLFMGAVCSKDRLAIVTELLPRGSLFKTLHKNNQALDIRRRLRMALDIARGMNYLHRRNPPIIHRDLKSSNLLVDRNWTVKVGDFGLSKLKNSTYLTAKSGRGTPQWMAPEVLRNEPSNEKSDVYSFGVILWELMTVSIPWHHLNPLQVVGVVGFMDRRLDLPEGLDPSVASIIRDCWKSDPNQRPSFEEIIKLTANLLHRALAQRSSAP